MTNVPWGNGSATIYDGPEPTFRASMARLDRLDEKARRAKPAKPKRARLLWPRGERRREELTR